MATVQAVWDRKAKTIEGLFATTNDANAAIRRIKGKDGQYSEAHVLEVVQLTTQN